ncbi:hypothetical protein SASPL_118509 [Salvia splendens]|uniref:PB1 domain-containing protein n=1 Tax=Salvia splendens TaxID=180675 RepID=A0A8X8ZZZ5_SALSN|nr:uncharacterized protein LOC121809437 [Salvia splendens]KAG6421949.1 hypothetical protein SASPL_118509 [Salvia splendens]
MENYSYNSYPESGDSSPRSREIDFENPPPWEDSQGNQPPPNYKVKFMCSYGGKIHPRPHDNQLSYIGGETKILSVDRNIKFGSLLSKLVALCDNDSISFKYQLPGEDLDALISVTNDDDLEHMMHEYERLYRISPKPTRLRIFIFTTLNQSLNSSTRSFGSDEVKSEKERFVEALNSAPIITAPLHTASAAAPLQPQTQPPAGNIDFMFGLEKANAIAAAQPTIQQPMMGRVPDVEDPVFLPGQDERSMAMDPIQKHIQEQQRLRLEEQQGIYRRKSEDNLPGGYPAGEYYKVPEKAPPPVMPSAVTHWPENRQIPGGMFPTSTEQPVYMVQTPAGAYHAPMMRPVTGAPAQGYYAVQRMPSDQQQQLQQMQQQQQIQQQQQMYNVIPHPQPAVASMAPPPQQQKAAGYSEGFGMVRAGTGGGVGVVTEAGYAQVAYDVGAGRQVMYTTAQGGMVGAPPQYQAVVSGADMRTAGGLNPEAGGGRGVPKVTQTQASM